MGENSGEREHLLDAIVKALEPYDIPTGSWTAAEKVEPARAVLDALGLVLVGWCDDPEWTDTTKTVGRLWHKSKPQMGGVPVYRLAALPASDGWRCGHDSDHHEPGCVWEDPSATSPDSETVRFRTEAPGV